MPSARDVFISYDSDDLAWAERLRDGLATRGLSSFLARESIVPGTQWEQAIVDALNSSKHLVVLWSAKAKDSSWVIKEMARFEGITNPSGRGSADRFLVQVPLDDTDASAFSSLQVVPDIKEGKLYPGGALAVSDAVWARVVNGVADALQIADGSLPVPVLIVSMTAAQLDAIDVDHKPPDIPTMGALLGSLGLSKTDLAASYGDTVRSWRPFGSDETIEQILARLNQGINQIAVKSGRPFRWDYVDGDFWGDGDRVDVVADRLVDDSAVIVVDALSLYAELVRSRLPTLDRSFHNEKALFLVPAPFRLPDSNVELRRLIQKVVPPVFRNSIRAPCP